MKTGMEDPKVLALAEAWASIDGKLPRFHACRKDSAIARTDGTYSGYMIEAQEMIKRLEMRGFVLTPKPSAD